MPAKHIEERRAEEKQRENLRYINWVFIQKRAFTFQPPISWYFKGFQEEEKSINCQASSIIFS